MKRIIARPRAILTTLTGLALLTSLMLGLIAASPARPSMAAPLGQTIWLRMLRWLPITPPLAVGRNSAGMTQAAVS